MTQEIHLSKGKGVALVSGEDYEYLGQWGWYRMNGYAVRSVYTPDKTITIRMHRVIVERVTGGPIPKGYEIDHISMDKLDNRRENLRLATRSQNMMNRGGYGASSQYKGVSWHKEVNKWAAQIGLNGQIIRLGLFHSEEEAARAYDVRAGEFFGEFARLNFSNGQTVAEAADSGFVEQLPMLLQPPKD